MDSNYDLSLIIPTYNRSKYLQRILTYYNKKNVKYEIVIPDSSLEIFKTINRKIIKSFKGLTINHLDYFSSEINYYHKIAQTFDFISKEYSVLCADDDFIIPDALDRSITFLENHPDFTAVGGYYINFLTKLNKNERANFYWKRYLTSFPHIKDQMNLNSSDPKVRLTTHFAFFVPTLYYVHQSDIHKMIFRESLPYTQDLGFAASFGELLQDMLTAIHGKIKTLKVLYGARESIPVKKGDPAKYAGVIQILKDGSFYEHYSTFRNCLARNLSQKGGIDHISAKKIVNEGMNLYLQRYMGYYLYSSKNKQILKSIGQKLYYFFVNLDQHKILSTNAQVNLNHWNWSKPPSKFYREFMNIRETVLANPV